MQILVISRTVSAHKIRSSQLDLPLDLRVGHKRSLARAHPLIIRLHCAVPIQLVKRHQEALVEQIRETEIIGYQF